MKILLLLMCLQLQATFELGPSPDLVTFKRTLIASRRISDLDRELTQTQPSAYSFPDLIKEVAELASQKNLAFKAGVTKVYITTKAAGAGRPLFFCSIESTNQNPAGLLRQYIVCTNKAMDQSEKTLFSLFRHHQGYYRRPISKVIGAAQSAFIKSAFERLLALATTVLEPPNIGKLYELVERVMANEKLQGLAIKQKFELTNSRGFDIVRQSPEAETTPVKLYQGVAFTINSDYFGLDFSLYDKSKLVVVPRRNIDSAFDTILDFLSKDLETPEEEPPTTSTFPEKIRAFIGDQCKSDVPVLKTGMRRGSNPDGPTNFLELTAKRESGNVPTKPEEICGFSDTRFLITHFHYGFMQYYLVNFDSKQFAFESPLVIERKKFDEKLTDMLGLIKTNADLIVKAQANSNSEVLVTVEGIQKTLKDVFGTDLKEEGFTDGEKAALAKPDPNSKTKAIATPLKKYRFSSANIIVRLLSNSDGFVLKLAKVPGKNYTPVYGEITLPAANGYDYVESLRHNLEDYLKKTQQTADKSAESGNL